jgi:hypothetical protein
MTFFDETALRTGQRRALETTLTRLRDGLSYTAIVMATRYGKSDLQRITAMAAVELGLACAAISLSPNLFLRNQMNSNEKWEAFCRRIKLTLLPKHIAINECVQDPTANGEHFVCVTMGLFVSNLKFFKNWAESKYQRTSKPVLLMVDECHTHSAMKRWGTAVTEWQQATHGHVTLYTATPERTDGERIPGFEYSPAKREDVVIAKSSPGKTPEYIHVDLFDGVKTVLNIKHHSLVTFENAWDEEVLCHVEKRPFDIDLDIVLGEDFKHGMLSSINDANAARRAISQCMRHLVVINDGCHELISRLRLFRSVDPKIAGIVFCGSDTENGDESTVDKHAKQIKRAISRIDPALNAIIATSATDGSVKDGPIDQFADGTGDILIVKQMASLGLDIPRIKVGLDLSTTRTKNSLIQRMMRIATPYPVNGKMVLVCSWVTPADIIFEAVYKSLVVEGGGEASVTDLEWIGGYEKKKEEPEEKPIYTATGTRGMGSEDTKGNIATESELDIYAKGLLDVVPEVGAFISQSELVERLKRQEKSKNGSSSENTGDKVQNLRDQINDAASSVVRHVMRMRGPYTQEKYETASKDVWRMAWATCNIQGHIQLKHITDLAVLQRLRETFSRMMGMSWKEN